MFYPRDLKKGGWPAVKDLCVAAVIMRCELGKSDVNLARINAFARRAAAEGAHIICFPEACLTGYGVHRPVTHHADTIPGPLTEAVLRMARENGLTILAGLIEKGSRGHLHLSHFAASPDGITGIYRKVHLGTPEQGLYRAGQELPVFKHHNVTFGIELCYDAHFPELSTQLALRGAELLFIAHASPRGSPKQKYARWSRYLPARAMDNGVFVVACNQTGKSPHGLSFPGVGLIVDPRGRVISKAVGWEERMILAMLREEVLREVRHHPMAYYLRHRRNDLDKM